MKLTRVITDFPGSYFLFGPRGTGKSTWLRENVKFSAYLDLLDDNTFRQYLANPGRLEDVCAGFKEGTVVIDEIQRIPALLPMVHKLIVAQPAIRFILTGSSARKIRRSSETDLLGGRAALRHMHPFMASEMGEAFTLSESLKLGMLPLVRASQTPQETLNGYINLYLRQEVIAEGVARNAGAYARFLETLSFSQGNLLNISEISRECAMKRTTAASYVESVEDLLIGRRLEVFARRARRAVVSHAKFYFFDCGVYQTLRPRGPLDSDSEMAGAALETLVYSHLHAWIDYSNNGASLSFWRTHTGLEVDFVVYGPQCFHAIEVKSSAVIHPRDLHGLMAFKEDYPEAMTTLIYNGSERLLRNGILCIPAGDFLTRLKPLEPLEQALGQVD